MAAEQTHVVFKRADGTDVPGYLHVPAGVAAGSPAVIVIQEWWGVNDQVKVHARDFGNALQFPTLVPDLYRGKVGVDAEEASHLMGALDWAGAIQDIRGAAMFLLARGASEVYALGFCMGGALAMASAVLVPEVARAVPFYGVPSAELCNTSTCAKPVLGHFGLLDNYGGFSDPAAASGLDAALTAGKSPHYIHSYAGVSHGFMNNSDEFKVLNVTLGRPEFNRAVYDLAFQRTIDFLKFHF